MNFYIIYYPNSKGHEKKDYPYIELLYDKWNDFGYCTSFTAHLYINDHKSLDMGALKILHITDNFTINVIDKNFESLEEGKFCSLGQSMEYYRDLRTLEQKLYEDILHSLKDVAIYKEYYEKFKGHGGIGDSFFRSSEAKKAFSSAIQYFGGEKRDEIFNFTYKFNPPYSNQKINITFDYSKKDFVPNKMFVLVGKNGCGKTQFMERFANSLCGSESKENSIEAFDNMPLFSKVIAVSFSAFDDFKKPQQDEKRNSSGSEPMNNYIYCGIQGNDEKTLSLKEMREIGEIRFKELRKNDEKFQLWKRTMMSVLENEFEVLLKETEPEKIFEARLSSGQNILLYTMTNVIANIEYESILLFDEPELHLHPNAISNLMRTLSDLLKEYNSYAIVCTHSPLIVQETASRYIKKFVREDNLLDVRELSLESLGENLTSITEEVFNVKDVESYYKTIFRTAVNRENKNLDAILNKFPNGLSYNAMTYISVIEKNKQNRGKN
ncbi:AAA family ATPase [Paenibacillus agricola]|uniref:AAA family ATPase n=1 Tax=Paenibacillus agricola TaxID=2716264 RepID=A0ABX0JEN7_9BACL|nr:AAA family ATPase [Paenibacillus agricola]NHN34622.1 AAA family ATPase [Paenibacillus agricola]